MSGRSSRDFNGFLPNFEPKEGNEERQTSMTSDVTVISGSEPENSQTTSTCRAKSEIKIDRRISETSV